MNTSVAIILPAYNEEQTIGDTISGFYAAMPDASIWVIDNNSTDNTESISRQKLSELNAKGGIISEPRQGKGNAIRRAFHEIDAAIYVLADADFTYPAEQLANLVDPIVSGKADMVVGDRHSGGYYSQENKRPLHNFGNRLIQWLVNRLFGASLVDIMSGYRALSRLFVQNYPILVEGFEIETDMTLHALDKRLRITEVVISYRDRPSGSFSKLHTIRDGFKVVSTITRIFRYYRPLAFFGVSALICALLGMLAGVPVLQDWMTDRYVHHIPLAILATGIEIVAIVLAAMGLILDTIANQDKRNFERNLLNHHAPKHSNL